MNNASAAYLWKTARRHCGEACVAVGSYPRHRLVFKWCKIRDEKRFACTKHGMPNSACVSLIKFWDVHLIMFSMHACREFSCWSYFFVAKERCTRVQHFIPKSYICKSVELAIIGSSFLEVVSLYMYLDCIACILIHDPCKRNSVIVWWFCRHPKEFIWCASVSQE